MNKIKEIDKKIFEYINLNFKNKFLDIFMLLVTNLGGVAFGIALPIALLIIGLKGNENVYNFAIEMGSGLIVTTIIVQTLKVIIGRKRPYECSAKVRKIGMTQLTCSFPSGHTTTAFMILMTFAMQMPSLLLLFIFLALLVGISRIYIGVHYPTDVLVGMTIGVIVALINHYFIYELVLETVNRYIVIF